MLEHLNGTFNGFSLLLLVVIAGVAVWAWAKDRETDA